MNYNEIVKEVQSYATERTKKRYVSNGAKEPVFGLTIKDLKPIAKQLLKQDDCQELAYELYDSGNYDLMYLAGMIVNPHDMDEKKFEEWMDKAYFYMISDFIVAVCLCETEIAIGLADKWIASGEELRMSAGYSTYCWMLGNRKDEYFDKAHLEEVLHTLENTISDAPNRAKHSMSNFVYTLGLSYIPLHKEAMEAAKRLGEIEAKNDKGKVITMTPLLSIEKEVDKGRVGFKRNYVRC